ncbi:DsbA family protein [Sedimenticola sp.]|uniref:DsbA family protein n=1 Tax=Sedimenticola sp. TaxID=1940285 RepID=UPI0025896F06|nr:DsbA family protein [Sedimenticola sp.]MCW8905537.1 DsbA family protein [Sedimenticola sp.]
MNSRLYYVHDPMCSWCWAFRPVMAQITEALPSGLSLVRLLGGLAPDSDEPMPGQLQDYLQATWRTIEQRVPGTRFNFDFWIRCQPRRSTYPACRAVIAARLQAAEAEPAMILAIQQAYYLHAMNPSDDDTLISLAGEIGLDGGRFTRDLNAPATRQQLEQEILLGRSIGAEGFPSLILEQQGRHQRLDYDYRDPAPVLAQLNSWLDKG